jgi:ABC-2 type transport system ATP-binding protein
MQVVTQQLSRHYGRRVGIEDVNLGIDEGEIFGFLGPNGAGKTTTIRLLLGFLRPSRGHATIFGLDCWQESPRIKQDIGYVPGDLRLYPWFTGRSALSIVGKVRGLDLRQSGQDLADRFQLEMNVRVREMSRGMRQKLGLVLALAHKPRLLILDEPTSALDPLMQSELTNCLRETARLGCTVFFSSHTLSEVEALCDRIAIVRDGHIVADESLSALRSRAGRIVKIHFSSAEAATRTPCPTFLKFIRQVGSQWDCELEGTTSPLIRWAAELPIDDISISPPDLDSVFRKFYEPSSEHT